MKKIKKIGAVSLGKIMGIMYALIGIISGGLITIFSLLGNVLFSSEVKGTSILFGIGAIIFLPIFYGVFGFIFGVLSGWFYNLAANWIGGLEVELQEKDNVEKSEQL